MPGDRTQARRAGNRPRVPAVIGQIGRENARLVGRNDHVVFLGLLGEDGNLLLHHDMTGIRAPAAAGVDELPLLDDLSTELGGRFAIAVGKQLVFGMRAMDQQDTRHFFHMRN